MKKRVLSLALAVFMLLSLMPVSAMAATLGSSPNAKIEYSYSSSVQSGTIRYISQNVNSGYFYSAYWPSSSFGGYSHPSSECGTASISMALSYVGINKTPKQILEANNGETYFSGWGATLSEPGVSTGVDNYVNGNGKYSPLLIHLPNYSSAGHWVIIAGKVSSNVYTVVDPYNDSTWNITINGSSASYVKGGSTVYDTVDRTYQYYNSSSTIITYQTIWFDGNGGTPSRSGMQVAYGCKPDSLPTATRDGYTFSGWYTSASGGTEVTTDTSILSDMTLYAHWEKNQTTVSLHYMNGNAWKSADVDVGSSYTLPSTYPKESGYYFSGWSYSSGDSSYDLRPGDSIDVSVAVNLFPVYISHSDAISGEEVAIYNIDDFTDSGYKVEPVQKSVSVNVDKSYWSGWSDYSTSYVGNSDTVEVRTATMYRYYYFLCPSCGAHEPFWGTSDCGASIPSDAWNVKWFTTPYSDSNYKTFSYTTAKYYTASLGDGEMWIFSSGNLNDTRIGTVDADGDAEVIATGYSYRKYVENYETSTKTITVYVITPACDEHVTEIRNAKAATCTEAGYTGDEVCKTCGETVKTGTTIAALGHSYTNGVCTRCGEKDAGYQPPHIHVYTDIVTAPTCTEWGYTTHTCACGDSYVDTYVDALGHTYTDVVTAPTCTNKGYTTHTCSCGYSYVDTYVDALGHDTELKNVKSATCTEAGYTGDEVCKTCGKTVKAGTAIAATGHDTELKNAKSATCTEAGYTGDEVCKTCGKTVKAGSAIAATGHDTELKNVKSATCTKAGYTGDEVCKTCGTTVKAGTEIAATGHDTELKNVKSATCTEAGYTGDEVCKTCGTTVKAGSAIAATGHDTELKNAKAATCTEAGYTGDEVCKTCGKTVKAGSAIAATGHDYKDGVCTVCGAKDSGYVPPHTHAYTDTVTAPTCTEKGYTTHSCSCGDSYVDTYVDAVGHKTVTKGAYPATTTEQGYTGDEVCEVCGVTLKVGSLIPVISGAHTHDYIGVVTAPTCRDKGYTTHTCSCGDSYIDSYVDALGHDTKLVNVQSATCTSDGYTGDEVCTRCGVTVKVGALIEALGHDYKDGACTRCGAKDPNGGSSVEPTPAVSFTDVADTAYYAKPVAWAVANNITGGYSDNTFRPMNICTRAQIVTFLWRANGSPEPQGTSQGFNDVFEGTYYYKAVLWAAEQGITGGFNDGGFHPDEFVTRAQAMTFLWRANGKPAVPEGTVNTFTDVPDTAYYHDAVLWAVANNITGGYNNSTFGSMDGCTRAQIVTFLYRDMAQ